MDRKRTFSLFASGVAVRMASEKCCDFLKKWCVVLQAVSIVSFSCSCRTLRVLYPSDRFLGAIDKLSKAWHLTNTCARNHSAPALNTADNHIAHRQWVDYSKWRTGREDVVFRVFVLLTNSVHLLRRCCKWKKYSTRFLRRKMVSFPTWHEREFISSGHSCLAYANSLTIEFSNKLKS